MPQHHSIMCATGAHETCQGVLAVVRMDANMASKQRTAQMSLVACQCSCHTSALARLAESLDVMQRLRNRKH